ncbi:carbamoyltransferase HypF [Streptomyces oryzae]|uniref:Carbamoyltransferase n=1 Tax=Streptomyces oryzae TaxID=1434886 RepID=A0ABS3XI96_9ACTN|nr:carbamoyltransferase HypF [Streptomyces oryzae]MBO8195116.1 carbamoyltransferase HypF [Streptomyces oryzae]
MSKAEVAGAVGTSGAERSRVLVRGVVQGVGFRPYVYALAGRLGLSGYVTNTGEGVVAEVEGAGEAVAAFRERIGAEAPPLAVVESVTHQPLPPAGSSGFRIVASRTDGARRTLVAPDTATCEACLRELADPADRRYRHPFLTCTDCGPRFTIVTGLPYDRANTTMARFPMCERCRREYDDPADRRFHAQPVACHDCGPRARLLVPAAQEPGRREPSGEPVTRARELLAGGAVVAVKGLGGYHLACDAGNEDAVRLLRRRKQRGDKPFAVLAREVADIEPLAVVGPAERALLTGSRRPIVLLRRRAQAVHGGPALAGAVAPGSPDLGVMLPYTPLHHLLMGLPGDPPGPRLLVLTSGNLGGEPIVTSEAEALERLAQLADAFLTHDRPIQVPCDDSVVRVCAGEELPVRRSRGYAPLPLTLPVPVRPALAVGGDLKNVFCLGEGRQVWLSAHIGDMDDLATLRAFERAEEQLEGITGVTPGLLVADRHPGYRSARWAERNAGGRTLRRVQHHHAHIASVLAENGLDGSRAVLGVAFDGTGYGDDGAVWGGEFLLADYDGFTRFAHLRYAPLAGGDAAVRRPYRTALARLWAAGLRWDADLPCVAACPDAELRVLERQLERGVGCVPTSSMGRLFDAVSSLAGVCHRAGYEAQAAIELEAAAALCGQREAAGYDFPLRAGGEDGAEGADGGALVADPGPLLAAVVDDLRADVPRAVIAARFHTAVAALVRRTCAAAREQYGVGTVALSGGVFANAVLSELCLSGLRADGFTVLRHRLVPPGDGGLALGQLVVAARETAPLPGPPPPAGSAAH